MIIGLSLMYLQFLLVWANNGIVVQSNPLLEQGGG